MLRSRFKVDPVAPAAPGSPRRPRLLQRSPDKGALGDQLAREKLLALKPYLPRVLHREILGRVKAPSTSVHTGACMLLDISGFTPLTERYCAEGPAGADALTTVLNAFFSEVIDLVHGRGGDVIKFAGDALICVFVDHSTVVTNTLSAVSAALAFRGLASSELRIKTGVSCGPMRLAKLGGVGGRWECLLLGEALVEACVAEAQAQAGDVVVSSQAWGKLRRHVAAEQLAGGGYLVEGLHWHGNDASPALPTPALSQRKTRVTASVASLASGFVPAPALRHIQGSSEMWIAEVRRVSVVFARLAAFDAVSTPVIELQTHFEALQRALAAESGVLRQFIVDDKGCVLIACFGLPSLRARPTDAAGAVRFAAAALDAMEPLGTVLDVGVASGRAYCGAVGSVERKEYAVVGDVANVAARLMCKAGGGALLCEATAVSALQSDGSLRFRRLPPLSLKGKAEPIGVFTPDDRAPPTPPGTERTLNVVSNDRLPSIVAEHVRYGHHRGLLLLAKDEEEDDDVAVGHRLRKAIRKEAVATVVLDNVGDDLLVEKDVLGQLCAIAAVHSLGDVDLASLVTSITGVPFAVAATWLENPAEAEVAIDAAAVACTLIDEILRPVALVVCGVHRLGERGWAFIERCMSQSIFAQVILTAPFGRLQTTDLRRLLAYPAMDFAAPNNLALLDVLRLVDSILPDGTSLSVGCKVFAATGGAVGRTKTLITSLAQAASEPSSPDLSERLEADIFHEFDHLPLSAQTALKVASVASSGRECCSFTAQAVQHAVPRANALVGQVEGDLEALARAGFISRSSSLSLDTDGSMEGEDDEWRFSDLRLRNTVYAMLGEEIKDRTHRAIGLWIERSLDAADPDPAVMKQLAHHFSRSKLDTHKAVQYLTGSARLAFDRGDTAKGVKLVHKASGLAFNQPQLRTLVALVTSQAPASLDQQEMLSQLEQQLVAQLEQPDDARTRRRALSLTNKTNLDAIRNLREKGRRRSAEVRPASPSSAGDRRSSRCVIS